MQGAGGLKGHSAASFTKIDEEIHYILGAGAVCINYLSFSSVILIVIV